MHTRPLAQLSDTSLLLRLARLVTQDRETTADLIACMVEVRKRRLYRRKGYGSMYAYCMGVLKMSADVACKRMRVARLSRMFPRILDALRDGRLNVTGLVILSYHVTRENGADLLDAAEGKTIKEIRLLIAERFPRPDVPTLVVALTPPAELSPKLDLNPVVTNGEAADVPGPPEEATVPGAAAALGDAATLMSEVPTPASDASVVSHQPAETRPDVIGSPVRMFPLAPRRFALQTTIDQETSDLLEEAQELLGHVGTNHVPDVMRSALRLYVAQLRKQKYGATDSPRPGPPREHPESRYIPLEVRRQVWDRDGGQCTFVSEDGHRCEERVGLQFDHAVEYALGGEATADNLRLRCAAHNQYTAERTFGVDFMQAKREERMGTSGNGEG